MERGCFNDEVTKAKALEFFGTSDNQLVRLLSYVDYCLKNGGDIDWRKLSESEIGLIQEFCVKRWLGFNPSTERYYVISKEFFDVMTDILWDAYVLKDESY